MRAHLSHLRDLLRHKWHVFEACRGMGVPLHRAIVHDWSKFTPTEWAGYVHTFYHPDGSKRDVRDSTGAYNPAAISEQFDYAWLHHQRNRHHWQAWVVIGDGGELKPLRIPETYAREMVADWIGAGRTYGNRDTRAWFAKNRQNMVLHPVTESYLRSLLHEAAERGLIPPMEEGL
jgi:hypothetical protein